MAGNVNIPLYMNPADQDQRQKAMDMMRAQMMAQQLQKMGEMPPPNETAGGVVFRRSPLELLSKVVAQGIANEQQLKAAQLQMDLMGQAMPPEQGGSGANPANAGWGIGPGDLRVAAMFNQVYGEGAGKAYLDSRQPTPAMKDAAASGISNPLVFNQQNAENTARANAGMKPATYTQNGVTYQTTEAGLAGMSGGGALPKIAANVPNQPLNPARGSLTASEAAIPTPPQSAGIVTNGSVGGMPLSGAANTALVNSINADRGNPGMVVAGPADQKLLEGMATGAQKFGDDLNAEATQALLQKRSLAQMKQYFSDFTPGKLAGLQQAIAEYKLSLGDTNPETIRIAASMQGVNKQAASLALEQMKALNNAGGSSGNGNRVEFMALLQNTPNTALTADGAKTIIDFMDKGTDIPIQKQQAYQEFLKTNSPMKYQDFNAGYNRGVLENIPKTVNNFPASKTPPVGAVPVGASGGKQYYKVPGVEGKYWVAD